MDLYQKDQMPWRTEFEGHAFEYLWHALPTVIDQARLREDSILSGMVSRIFGGEQTGD